MIKTFCDRCGKEIARNYAYERVRRRLEDWQIELYVAHKDNWNGGDLCLNCLTKIFEDGKDIERE